MSNEGQAGDAEGVAVGMHDRRLARSLCERVAATPGLRVAAGAADAGTLDRLAGEAPIDLVVADAPTVRALRRGRLPALARRRRPLLLAATAERLPELLPTLRQCDGLVLLDDAPAPLGPSVALARSRLCALPTALVGRLRREEPRRRLLAGLGPRDRAVLRRLAAGAPNRAIAESLGLPEATVKAILRRLTLRLGFDNRTQAAVFAARHLAEMAPDG